MLPKSNSSSNSQQNCCRLVRADKSARLLLPLARRSRPHLSSRCRRFLCQNCLNIKRKQEHDLLKISPSPSSTTKNIFQALAEQENKPEELLEEDIAHEIEFSLINESEQSHLNNVEYDSSEMLIWNLNSAENASAAHPSHQSSDTGSLTNHEKKILLQEAIEKLRIVLHNRPASTTSIPENDLDKIEFTYRALQTTVHILSSSLDSL